MGFSCHLCLRIFTWCTRRALPHFGLLGVVIIYITLGGAIFSGIESGPQQEAINKQDKVLANKLSENVKNLYESASSRRLPKETWRLKYEQSVRDLLKNASKPQTKWSFGSGVFYSFTLVTTIGHANVTPTTTLGKALSLVYAFIGIPLALVTIANLGKFLAATLYIILSWLAGRRCCGLRCSKIPNHVDSSLSFALVMIMLLSYALLGAYCYLHWEHTEYFESFYFVALSLFTVGTSIHSPQQHHFLFVVILYVIFGLIILSLLLQMIAVAIRKIHYLGIPPSDLASLPVWFGRKKLNLGEIVNALGQASDLDKAEIDELTQNLDDIIDNAIREKEGKPVFASGPLFERERGIYSYHPYSMLYSIAQESIPYFDDRDSVGYQGEEAD